MNEKIEYLKNLIQAIKYCKNLNLRKDELFLDSLELTSEDLERMIPIIAKELPEVKFIVFNE